MKSYHFIGIGGIGMSGLARLLLQQQIAVTGSDVAGSDIVDNLKGLGAKVALGHTPQNVPAGATVVVSSGINLQNPEMQHALEQELTILHRSDLLHRLMQAKKPLLVAGTHGKTTTTSLLTSVLLAAKMSPSYAVGGILVETGCNASHGNSEYFVAEADESDGTFLKYAPFGAIITNIDNDHMDHFKTEEALIQAFKRFREKVGSSEHLFYCGDDIHLSGMRLPGISYGFAPTSQLRGSHFSQDGWKIRFDISFEGHIYPAVEVNLLGYHNALNALAVFGLCLKLGLKENVIREALAKFKGVKRRMEKKGEVQNVLLLDDYGHHPTEIKTTLRGIKNAHPERRVIALFQPHRYSRTRDCLKEFGSCFEAADQLIVTDIYAAGETPIPGIDALKVLEKVHKSSLIPAGYMARENLAHELFSHLRPFDIVVTVGAGDINKVALALLDKLHKDPLQKYHLGIISGGKSTEHEISLLSAKNIAQGIDSAAFEVSHFFISKEGSFSHEIDALRACDCIFPVLHGPLGEDGTIQGLFEMLDLAYAGCDHQSSAICMDKAVTKKLAMAAGLSVAPFVDFSVYAWQQNPEHILNQIQAKLSFPLYVKPVHLGSTVGVKRVSNQNELLEAIDKAFRLDKHLLVEKEIRGREIEFSVLGRDQVRVFPPGEIFTAGAVYGYDEKYGAQAFQTTPTAQLTKEQIQQGMQFAKNAYLSCGCDGFARVDCFLDERGNYLLNEINPIPGFTANSLFPKMCEAHGMPLTELLNTLICWGLQRKRSRARLITNIQENR